MQTISQKIDLSPNLMERLSEMAKVNGKSLKSYIENILAEKANESPSPSNDPWFDDPENMKIVEQGIEEAQNGEGKLYTASELISRIGL